MAVVPPAERARRLDYIIPARERGEQWQHIAAHLGLRPDHLAEWFARQMRGPTTQRPKAVVLPGVTLRRCIALKPGETVRKCMTCGEPFASEGAHHRLCDTHRRAGSGSPYIPDPGGNPGRQVWARRS